MKLRATTISKAMSWAVLGVLVLGLAQQNNAPAPPAVAVGTTAIGTVRTENNNMPADFNADLRVFYMAPGGNVPAHWHPGPTTVLVLEGEMTFTEKGVSKVYKAGQSWTEAVGPDNPHEIANKGTTMAAFAVMALTPKGSTLTNLVQR